MPFSTVRSMRVGTITVPGFMAGAVTEHRVEWGVWAFLVECEGTTILFDGGLVGDMDGTDAYVAAVLGAGFGYTGGDASAVHSALANLDVRPEDIDIAVLSHLHHDHAGALDWIPRAAVWVHAAELEVLLSPYAKQVAPSWQVTPGTRRSIDRLASTNRLVVWKGGSTNLSETVQLVLVGGHTRGSVALLADVRLGWRVGLLGDLLPTEAHVKQGIIPTNALDAYSTIRSVARMLDSAHEVWPGHAIDGPVVSASSVGSWPLANEWRGRDD